MKYALEIINNDSITKHHKYVSNIFYDKGKIASFNLGESGDEYDLSLARHLLYKIVNHHDHNFKGRIRVVL